MKLFVIILLLFVPAIAVADPVTYAIAFSWDQETASLPNLSKWTLKMRPSPSGVTEKLIDVPYTTGAGPNFTSTQNFSAEGAPGATIRKYFVVTATGKNGNESGPSNEVYADFKVPYADVTTPINLRVNIILQ